ncbi:UNVERIFIED_CONTAM: hypothetical protein HDU68_010534 [Siphonaria sp. JEL0065]|nr:hypothetical protein HDU68_010534 [Siphonaria sp. JEL0065]
MVLEQRQGPDGGGPPRSSWVCSNSTSVVLECSEFVQPCWASTHLCDGLNTECNKYQLPRPPPPPGGQGPPPEGQGPTSPCAQAMSNFTTYPIMIKGSNVLADPPSNTSLEDLALAGYDSLFILATAPVIQQTTAVGATASVNVTLGGVSPQEPSILTGSNIAIVGGAIGTICFVAGLVAAYAVVRRRKPNRRGSLEFNDPTETSSQTMFASKQSATGVRGGGSGADEEGEEVEMIVPKPGVARLPRGFKDDFFDDTSSINPSIGVSTHISEKEVRPFQAHEFWIAGLENTNTGTAIGVPVPQATLGGRLRQGRGAADLQSGP